MASSQILKGTGNNSYLYQEATASAAAGLDATAQTFKIVTSAASGAIVSSTAQFTIDPAANGNVTIDPNGTGATVCQSGDLNVIAGNINVTNSNSAGTQGFYNIGTNRFLHNFATTSTGSVFVGALSGNLSATGDLNTGIGGVNFSSLTSGTQNCAMGANALGNLTSGIANTVIGAATFGITTGSFNTGIGFGVFTQFSSTVNGLKSGQYNVAVGYEAAQNYRAAESHNIIINSNGVLSENNTCRIGSATGTGIQELKATYICGIDNVNVGSVSKVVTMASDQLGTASITAGTGITVTPGANTITIAATGMGSFTWSVITADQTAVVNSGYICNKSGTLALALPASAVVGSILEITGINTALGWSVTQASGQQIFYGASSTTLGATGSLTSSATRDSIRMVCVVANTTWQVISSVGNITVV